MTDYMTPREGFTLFGSFFEFLMPVSNYIQNGGHEAS
jgi:hypothetical protein